jgi:hypothetical protein
MNRVKRPIGDRALSRTEARVWEKRVLCAIWLNGLNSSVVSANA